MAVSAPEQSAITEVVQLYIDGSRLGDRDRLRRAFHPDARMYGSISGQRFDQPIEEFLCGLARMLRAGGKRGHARTLSLVDDLAAIGSSRRAPGSPWRLQGPSHATSTP